MQCLGYMNQLFIDFEFQLFNLFDLFYFSIILFNTYKIILSVSNYFIIIFRVTNIKYIFI
jgi:hypothetical protein